VMFDVSWLVRYVDEIASFVLVLLHRSYDAMAIIFSFNVVIFSNFS